MPGKRLKTSGAIAAPPARKVPSAFQRAPTATPSVAPSASQVPREFLPPLSSTPLVAAPPASQVPPAFVAPPPASQVPSGFQPPSSSTPSAARPAPRIPSGFRPPISITPSVAPPPASQDPSGFQRAPADTPSVAPSTSQVPRGFLPPSSSAPFAEPPPASQVPSESQSRRSIPPLPTSSHGPSTKSTSSLGQESTVAPSTSSGAARSSTNGEKVLEIYVDENSIIPSHQTSSVLRGIFESLVEYDGTCWKNVTEETKRINKEEFYKRCKWDPIYDSAIAALYLEKAAGCYRHMVGEWKKKWNTKKEKARGVSEDTWKNFLVHWAKPEVIMISDQNRKNRLSESCGEGTGSSRHRAGSRSARDHAIEIAIEKGRPATKWEVFVRLHPPNEDGSYTYGKPKKIAEEVQAKAVVLSQPLDGSTQPQPVDMGKLFVDTAGFQKGRIPGIGNSSKAYTKRNGCRNSTATSTISDDEISRRINERVEEMVEQSLGEYVLSCNSTLWI